MLDVVEQLTQRVLQKGSAGGPATFCTQCMSAANTSFCFSSDPVFTNYFGGLKSPEHV